MPLVVAVGNYDRLINNRQYILEELLQYFPGNISFREERRDELLAYYWYLPEDYNHLDLLLIREKISTLRGRLDSLCIDTLYLPRLLDPHDPSLFVFDMDSTMIREEVIDELARRNGLYDLVADVTRRAMEGGLGFEDALRQRVIHLKGLDVSCFGELYEDLHPNPGVVEALRLLKEEFSAKRAVLSGGFIPILKIFSHAHNLDYVEANHLIAKDEKLTGELEGRIVGKERKRDALLELKEKYKIDKNQVVAVGDGANDLLMIKEAGMGFGFHAKEGLKKEILNWLDHSPMTALLLLFGPSL